MKVLRQGYVIVGIEVVASVILSLLTAACAFLGGALLFSATMFYPFGIIILIAGLGIGVANIALIIRIMRETDFTPEETEEPTCP